MLTLLTLGLDYDQTMVPLGWNRKRTLDRLLLHASLGRTSHDDCYGAAALTVLLLGVVGRVYCRASSWQ